MKDFSTWASLWSKLIIRLSSSAKFYRAKFNAMEFSYFYPQISNLRGNG